MALNRYMVLLFSSFEFSALISFCPMGEGASAPPSTYLLNGPALMETRNRVLAGDPALAEGIKELRQRAERHMSRELWAVTNKPFAGPSGDKHDYVSLAPYFWPDPASPNGLPYINRDGELNPESLKYDRPRLEGMCEAVQTLALAHYLTGEERYGKRAAEQIRTWFLNESTRMNPHLQNTTMVKGKNEGNPWGILHTARLPEVIDGVILLRALGAWPDEDDKRLQQWFTTYLEWVRTSKLGIEEDAAPNNHGLYYDMQTSVFALYIGREDLAKKILESVKSRRIATQIAPDGSQPQELKRTLSWHYSLLNLRGMSHLARLGEIVGVDLWNFRTPDGRSIRGALDYMLPYAFGKPWEYKQIKKPDYERLVWVLRMAAAAYKEPAYEKAIARLPGVEREIIWANFLEPARSLEK